MKSIVTKIEVQGHPFFIREDKTDQYEVDLIIKREEYLKHFEIDEHDVFIDIGAHIGTFKFVCGKRGAKCHSFEPNAENFELLKLNTSLFSGYISNMAVVGNDDVSRTLFLNDKKGADAHSFYINKRRKVTEEVDCININDIIEKDTTGLKIDCEGSEEEIIMGIKEFRNIKKIAIEYHFNIIGEEGYWKIIEKLQENGYHVIYREDIKKNWHLNIFATRN